MPKRDRQIIDKVLILLGVVTTAAFLVIGGLAWWGYRFATNEVKTQLASQKIYFPAAGSPAITALPAADQAAMNKFAGQQLVNGNQAKVYADNFIAVHLDEVAGGQTYSQVSTAALSDPTNQKLQAQKAVLFQGETLRGLLLGDGYAYWTFGMLAQYVAIASFVAAGIMAFLVFLGIGHLSRVRK